MADITVTAANVLPQAGASIEHGTFGATITQGKSVYRDATTKKYLLADNDASAATKDCRGITLNSGADGQPAAIIRAGDLAFGSAVLVAGTTYCVSSTAGGICPQADVASGDDVIVVGVAETTSILNVKITDTGVTL